MMVFSDVLFVLFVKFIDAVEVVGFVRRWKGVGD
jgi:hypothetical protein